jgi:hypothetical protein
MLARVRTQAVLLATLGPPLGRPLILMLGRLVHLRVLAALGG